MVRPPSFQYDKSSLEIDNTTKYVCKITFNISRYGEIKHTLFFTDKLTEKEAVNAVEQFLSNPPDLAIF